VTWNAKRYVDECVRSLGKSSAASSTEIIVVDNASSDGTAELIEEALPQAHLIRNASNLGFARGNNLGIARSRGKYLFLINSDVTVPPGCIEKLAAFMEENPTVGMLGPQMLAPDGNVRRSTMRFPTLWNQFCRALSVDSLFKSRWAGGFLMPDFAHDRTRDVEVLNGWFWVVRREALDQVGPLDEQFFMYGEDIDWCYRFQQAGWRRVFYAGASALHYGGASSAAAPIRFYLDMQQANLQYWKKFHGPMARAAYYGITLLHHFLRVLGHGVAYLAKPGSREDAAYKVRRSWAVLRWLVAPASRRHAGGPAPLIAGRSAGGTPALR
jgi:GT2 family glycosyltransferase